MDIIRSDFNLRRPTLNDAQTVVDLMIACDIAESGEPDSDLITVADAWSGIDLSQDGWLVFSGEDRLIGYASVQPRGEEFVFDLYTHPSLTDTTVFGTLLDLCETRLKERLSETRDGVTAIVYCAEKNAVRKAQLMASGYAATKHYFGMILHMQEPPAPPTWPMGIRLRNFVPSQDDKLVYDFIQTAFERPGRVKPSFERWQSFMMGASNFDPALWFLAYHGEELIGAILCFEYPQNGWVRQLGVSTAWRKKGIGSALLQHCFGLFYQKGQSSVGLALDADNATAYQVYENAGMSLRTHTIEYQRRLE